MMRFEYEEEEIARVNSNGDKFDDEKPREENFLLYEKNHVF
jgi:hypothetical protein